MKRAGLLVVVLSAAAFGQNVTLPQLLEAAEKNNIDRRVSVEQRARADAEFRQAWTGLLPSLTVQGAWTHNEIETSITQGPVTIVISPLDQLDGTLRLDLPLIDTTRWMRTAAASAAQDAAIDRDAAGRDQVKRQVVSAWYQYAASLAVRESAKKSLGVAEAQVNLQDIREKAGAATELERLRSLAEKARTLQLVADAENLVAVSRRNLRTLTALDPGDFAQIPEDDLTPPAELGSLEGRADALPAVRAADQDVKAADRFVLAQQLAIVPVVGAQFTERVTNATGFSGKNNQWNAGLYLQWRIDVPLFMGWGVQSANRSAAQLQAERMRLLARDQIHLDWQRQRAAVTKVEAARAQVEAAQRAATVARDRYAAGVSTQVDVIQAERDLFGAEVGQIQARTDLAAARASLLLSAGLPLQ